MVTISLKIISKESGTLSSLDRLAVTRMHILRPLESSSCTNLQSESGAYFQQLEHYREVQAICHRWINKII